MALPPARDKYHRPTSNTAPYLQGFPVLGSLTSIPNLLSFAPMSFIICRTPHRGTETGPKLNLD